MSQVGGSASQLTSREVHDLPVPQHVAARAALPKDAVSPPARMTLPYVLLLIGAVAMLATLIAGIGGDAATAAHALSAYHAGVMFATSLAVGSMGFVMILQQVNAGWSAMIRRQVENAASLVPVCFVLFLPVLLGASMIFHWMRVNPAADEALAAKSAFLNSPFWYVRAVFYFVVWTAMATALFNYSRRQDENGDVWLTARARKLSSWGLLVFALTSAFAAFDWMMSMDYSWFSTMFGVYFFAGSIIATIALCIAVLGALRMMGKLEGVVTAEHFHDMGKLLLAFTVFWAYIAFSQYFLIWYGNLPEETWWFTVRQTHGWETIFLILALGHFMAPFLILLFRKVKRNYKIMFGLALWILLMHAVDLFYIVLPNLPEKADAMDRALWIDVIGIAGPALIFLGLVMWRVGRGPLVPIKDPRLHESLEHKNYV